MNEIVDNYGCHPRAALRELRKPDTWRAIFAECSRCGGRRELAILTSNGSKFWLCRACCNVALAFSKQLADLRVDTAAEARASRDRARAAP